MQKVIAEKRFEKGVAKTSDETWKKNAKEKGAPIIATRIREALDKWESNWGMKYQNVLKVIPTLPPKTKDPMTNIDQRLKKIVKAWRGEI